MARCSRVTGEGAKCSGMSYSSAICSQPVSSQRSASALLTRAMAADGLSRDAVLDKLVQDR